MKSLKMSVLILAVGAVLTWSVPGHAQQEVAADHFDQPSVVVQNVQRPRKPSPRIPAATQHQANRKLAGSHSQKTNHHQHARQIGDSRNTLGE